MKNKKIQIIRNNEIELFGLNSPNNLFSMGLVEWITNEMHEYEIIEHKFLGKVYEFDFEHLEKALKWYKWNPEEKKKQNKRIKRIFDILDETTPIRLETPDVIESFNIFYIFKYDKNTKKVQVGVNDTAVYWWNKMIESSEKTFTLMYPSELQQLMSLRKNLQKDYSILLYSVKKQQYTGQKIKFSEKLIKSIGWKLDTRENKKEVLRRLKNFTEWVNNNDVIGFNLTYEGKKRGAEYVMKLTQVQNFITKQEEEEIKNNVKKLRDFGVPYNFIEMDEEGKGTAGKWKDKQNPQSFDEVVPSIPISVMLNKEYIVLDFDNLEESQKEQLNKFKGTLWQNSNKGMHFIFKNDLGIDTASTQLTYEDLKVDFRGLGKAYFKLYEEIKGDEVLEFSKCFKLDDFRRSSGVSYESGEKVKGGKKTTWEAQKRRILEQFENEKHVSGKNLTWCFEKMELNNEELEEFNHIFEMLVENDAIHISDLVKVMKLKK